MKVRCNECMREFDEEDIVVDLNAPNDLEMEHCPFCGRTGALMDMEEVE